MAMGVLRKTYVDQLYYWLLLQAVMTMQVWIKAKKINCVIDFIAAYSDCHAGVENGL